MLQISLYETRENIINASNRASFLALDCSYHENSSKHLEVISEYVDAVMVYSVFFLAVETIFCLQIAAIVQWSILLIEYYRS